MLVNMASPALIEPAAVTAWHAHDEEARLGMDGYYTEPSCDPSADPHGLLEHPRACVTPHIAASTVETWGRMLDKAVQNIIDFDTFSVP